jgi:hypothetical protein
MNLPIFLRNPRIATAFVVILSMSDQITATGA